jgi:cytochrome b561
MNKTTIARYSGLAILLHWGSAAIIVALFLIGWQMVRMPLSPGKMEAYALHKSLGFLILVVAVARVVWRMLRPPPPELMGTPEWQRRAANATHVVLYLLMFALPMSGWVYNSSVGFPLSFFGLIDVPPLFSGGPDTKELWRTAHWLLGWGVVGLVSLHVGAALYHQVIIRDSILQRMLPSIPALRRH